MDSKFLSSSSSWWYPWTYSTVSWGVGQWLSHASSIFCFSKIYIYIYIYIYWWVKVIKSKNQNLYFYCFHKFQHFLSFLTLQVFISYTSTHIQKSIHNFLSTVTSLSLLPSLFFFFNYFFPFSHKAIWSRRMEAEDMVEAGFGQNRAILVVSASISTEIRPYRLESSRIDHFNAHICHNWRKKKKKKNSSLMCGQQRRAPHAALGAGAAALEPHPCFLVFQAPFTQ